MRYIASKLNIYIRNTHVIDNHIERVALPFIFWSFAILAFVYVLILGNMVSNIVARKNLEVSERALSSEVSELGLTYLSMSNGIDLTLSHSMGFKETKETFATRKSLGYNQNGTSGTIQIAQNGL